MVKRTNILIVEDQVIVRRGLRMIVEQEQQFAVVGEAGNGIEALRELEEHDVDVVLLDIRMPEMNGIETARNIKTRWPDMKILILTTFNDEEAAIETLKEGVNGFMLKTSEPEKVISAIHSCLKGGLVLHEEVAAKMVPQLLSKSEITEPASFTLTDREREIVQLVGEGKTNKEIAAALYLSVGTVKNHITNILQELQLRDRTQLAIFAVKHDLV